MGVGGNLAALAAIPLFFCFLLSCVGAVLWLLETVCAVILRPQGAGQVMPRPFRWCNYVFLAAVGLLLILQWMDWRYFVIYFVALSTPLVFGFLLTKTSPPEGMLQLLAYYAVLIGSWSSFLSSFHWRRDNEPLVFPAVAFADPRQAVFWSTVGMTAVFGSLAALRLRFPAASKALRAMQIAIPTALVATMALVACPCNALSRWTASQLIVSSARAYADFYAGGYDRISLLPQFPAVWLAQGFAERMTGGSPANARKLLQHSNPHVRMAGVHALAARGKAAEVEELISVMSSDGDPEIRAYCADHLGDSRDVRAVAPLILRLKDESEYVRARAAGALGTLHDRRALVPLVELLRSSCGPADKEEEESQVQNSAATALGGLVTPQDTDLLVAILRDRNWRARAYGAWLLGRARASDAVEPLSAALTGDGHYRVRANAAWALSEFQTEAVVQALISGLKDSHYEVRSSCAQGLGKVHRVADMSKVVAEALIGGLGDDHYKVRSSCAESLATVQRAAGMSEAAAQALDAALAKEKNSDARIALTYALESVKRASKIPQR